MTVEIPEKLFFGMVDLLVEPQALIPSEGKCVIDLDARNEIVGQLLNIQRNVLFGPSGGSSHHTNFT